MAEGQQSEAAPGASGQRGDRSHQALSPDRFDRLPKNRRVGAHRVVGRPHRFWIYLVSALLGIALLTGAGVIVLQVTGADITRLAEEAPEPTKAPPKVTAELDPTASVVVFNGTPTDNFEAVVDGIITQNGWGQILFSAPASSSDVGISAVFYSAAEDEPAALALAKELGGVSVFQTSNYDEYGARLVVLLGTDYGGPGSDQLVIAEAAPAE